MKNYETINVGIDGPIAVITINRPDKLNALSSEVHREGVQALDDIRRNDSVRVVVITGSGEKSFTSAPN